jgi:hypothetical protein
VQDFVLYEKLCDLADYLFPVVDRWPRHEKFALCTQTKNCVHDLTRLSIRAQKSRKEKLRWLYEMDVQLQMLRHFLRHAHSRRYLNNTKLRTVTKYVEEIGRILGGLIKSFTKQ